MGLGEVWLSKSQAWDRHQKEWFWVLLWGVGFVSALILISAVSEDERVLVLCFGNLRGLSPSFISSLSCDFSFHSLLSNLPTHSTVSHLKTSNTFLKPTSFPYCHSISLLPLEAKTQISIIASSHWHSSHCSGSDCHLDTPWLHSSKTVRDSFWVKSSGYFIPHLTWILRCLSHLNHLCSSDTISSDFPSLFLATAQFPFQVFPWPSLKCLCSITSSLLSLHPLSG